MAFPPIQGFSAPNLSAHRHSVSDQSPANFHTNLSECDTDMVDTVAGANATTMNSTSPEDDHNEDDCYGTKKDARLEMQLATIPEYFANKKTKGRDFLRLSFDMYLRGRRWQDTQEARPKARQQTS